jgi:SOS-response transcriptional repressor LexA
MKRKHDHIRLRNLELLILEAGTAAQLARIVGTNSSYLSQVRRQTPTRKGTPRRVGDDLAEKLERGMGKPAGWMDETHQEWQNRPVTTPLPAAQLKPDACVMHPLISWAQAAQWTKTSGHGRAPSGSELLPCPVICSEGTFVLRVHGASMEPRFHDGDLIFVDPEVPAANGKYVVVSFEEPGETTFKQLIVEGRRRYLRALNPDWPERIIEFGGAATICGVVVFKGETL